MKYVVCVNSQGSRYILQGEVYEYMDCFMDSRFIIVNGWVCSKNRFVFLRSNKINNILYGVPYGK